MYCWFKFKKNLAAPHIFIFDLDRKYIVKFFLPIVKSIIRRKKLIFLIAKNIIGKIKIITPIDIYRFQYFNRSRVV